MKREIANKLLQRAESIIKLTCQSKPDGSPALPMNIAGEIQAEAYAITGLVETFYIVSWIDHNHNSCVPYIICEK